MNKYSSNVWLWKDPEKQCLNKVLDCINASVSSDNDIIILKCEDVTGFEKSIPLTNYFFTLSLKFNVLGDDRTIFLNLKDMISSIELYLGRQKKDDYSEKDVLDEEIFKFHNQYISSFEINNRDDHESITLFKAFLKQNNCIDVRLLLECYQKLNNSDICKNLNSYRYLILGKPCSVHKQLIGILNEKIYSIHVEIPLNISLHGSPCTQILEEIKVDVESLEWEEITVNIQHHSKIGSATEEYVEDLILSFLSLLINSRNELALSKVMISPVINLSHEAFTALKHLSVEKEMPMCQVAISYVTRIRLGGKGYAPASDCPMLPHLKGLELFVDTLNQMQTLIEEESCPSTCIKRLINILKKKLLKCTSEKLKESSVEAVSENLQSTYLAVSDVLKTRISSNASQICQGTLDILYHFINFINSSSFIDDPKVIFSKKHIKRTPLNLPPLLGYFRSPEEESSCDTKLSLNEDSALSRSSLVHHTVFPSYFHQSQSSDMSVSCINSSTPSKLTFKGCLINEEKLQDCKTIINTHENLENKKRKRSILGEITNENISSKDKINRNCKTSNSKKEGKIVENCLKENAFGRSNNKKLSKKPAKKFKQIQGQGKITSFFIPGKSC